MLEIADRGNDQAAGLRRLLEPRGARLLCLAAADARRAARYACRFAAALEAGGESVLMLDLTRGELACASGIAGRYELMHVLDGVKGFDEVVFQAGAVPVLPAARGTRALAGAWRGRERFAEAVERAGRSPRRALAFSDAPGLQALAAASGAAFRARLLVTAAAAGELMAAYALLKRSQRLGLDTALVFDAAMPPGAAAQTGNALARTALDYLGRAPRVIGRLDPESLARIERETHVHG